MQRCWTGKRPTRPYSQEKKAGLCGYLVIFGELFSFRMGFQEMGWTMTDLICLKDH